MISCLIYFEIVGSKVLKNILQILKKCAIIMKINDYQFEGNFSRQYSTRTPLFTRYDKEIIHLL